MIFRCKTCARYTGPQRLCTLYNIPREPEDFCSDHCYTLETCDICGQPIPGPQILVSPHVLCSNCFPLLDTCQTCSKAKNNCEFETNPDPTPKVIRQQKQEGPMTIVQDALNPERIRKLCQNCQCYNEKENNCFRQSNQGCENYLINILSK